MFADFVHKCAELMAEDRPDIWSVDEAKETVFRWAFYLAENQATSVGSGGFQLNRYVDEVDGSTSYNMTRKLVDYETFIGEEPYIFDWTDSSKFLKGIIN